MSASCFAAFNNFGQEAITHKNLKGSSRRRRNDGLLTDKAGSIKNSMKGSVISV